MDLTTIEKRLKNVYYYSADDCLRVSRMSRYHGGAKKCTPSGFCGFESLYIRPSLWSPPTRSFETPSENVNYRPRQLDQRKRQTKGGQKQPLVIVGISFLISGSANSGSGPVGEKFLV